MTASRHDQSGPRDQSGLHDQSGPHDQSGLHDQSGGYRPTPIDTSCIDVPADIRELTEVLARNTHDVWARERMRDGWRFGRERSDRRKEHPLLVPYEQLSEADKDYDRNTAMETLKVILSLGYHIGKVQ